MVGHPLRKEVPPRKLKHRDRDLHTTVTLHLAHPVRNGRARSFLPRPLVRTLSRALVREVPQQPFEVARHQDVHRWAERLAHPARIGRLLSVRGAAHWGALPGRARVRVDLLIRAALPEPREDVVRVRRNTEAAHRKTHALRIISREDVAEVAGGDDELNLDLVCVRDLALQVEVGEEVVDSLGKDARPVDRVDRAQPVCRVELAVPE